MRFVALLVTTALTAVGASAGGSPPNWSGREAAARAEAQRLLAGIVLPAGASASATEPTGNAGALRPAPTGMPPRRELVGAGGWWIVHGQTPTATLEYIHEHSPELSSVLSWSPPMGESGVVRAQVRLGPATEVIGERRIQFRAVILPDGSTGVRADAQVLWLLPRDRIPAGARLLRIEVRRVRPGRPHPRVRAVRSEGRIARVVHLLNSLPAERPSFLLRSCPASFGTIRLAFYRKPSEAPLAVATVPIWGCGGAFLHIRNKRPQPELAAPDILAKLEHTLAIKIAPPR